MPLFNGFIEGLQILGKLIQNWWWILPPFFLFDHFLYFWRFWRNSIWWSKQRYVTLEIKIPREVKRPIKAMEQLLHSLWGNIYDPPDWWEKWIDGKGLLFFSLEMVGIDGELHFFLRIPEERRRAVEASFFSQYPDLEIVEVEDYTKNVPLDVPNENWDLWGCDYELVKPDCYPIKTYSKFFEEKPDTPLEEKRLDPISQLLEGVSTFKPGEQLWIQIVAVPITNTSNPDEGDPYVEKAKEEVERLLHREIKKPKPYRPIVFDAIEVLITGKLPKEEESQKEDIFSLPELRLSPGEREIVAAIEEKASKPSFRCWWRFIYIAKKDVYFGGAKAVAFGFFNQFATSNLNLTKPYPGTITKIKKHWFLPINLLRARRLYLRKRELFRNYVGRAPIDFPRRGLNFILNTEELATMFHFPGGTVAPAPSLPRLEAKKKEPPPGLPVE